MKNILFIALILPMLGFSQIYLHPTAGLQNTNLGSCMVTTCSGTYRDDGNNGNYSSNINGTYRTFCPSTPNTCIRLNFTNMNIEGGGGCPWELGAIINGATQNNPWLWAGCGNWGAAVGAYTSTDPSGCLGFRFWSDGSFQYAGWQATISCVPCGTGPTGTDNNDCTQNTPVCNNLPINSTSTGPGLTSTCTGCVVSENYSSWYHIRTQTAGTFNFTISPNNGTDDYDFALFQTANCAALGAPVRCSYAAGNANTGLANGAGDFSEDVTGNGWVEDINPVAVGTDFYLLVNDWSGTGGGYTLNWGGTASLDCAVLPVELLDFVGRPYDNFIELNWNTATELSLSIFEIEKYTDGEWDKILNAKPAGSNSFYSIVDAAPLRGNNIYRLKSIDLNGEYSYSKIINVNYSKDVFEVNITNSQIEILSPDIKVEKIELYNILGQPLGNISYSVLEGGSYCTIDLTNLKPNTYILRMNGVESKMFIKY